jgi:hypothetical protein
MIHKTSLEIMNLPDKLILEISKDLQEDPLLTTTWIERIKKEDGSYEINEIEYNIYIERAQLASTISAFKLMAYFLEGILKDEHKHN